ncbi:MAG: metallophosphoesterase [Bacteroidales bacterium]|nr:metallophosphoesterase [Bacteroidales bacterium]
MNKLIFIVSLLLAGCNLFAQNRELFKSEIETDKKPWTHLNFYNDPDNFQFAIVTDRNGGNRPGIFEDAVSKINILYPEFVLSVGDLINGYTKDTARIRYEWNEVNQVIDELKMPFFYLPGNHDITNQVMAKEWEKRYGKRYYDFIYKNTLFIILDSNDDDDYNLTREQTDFALETISRHPDVRWTFLLMHHPIWTYNTNGRFEELETALSDRKYTVLAGHTHHYTHEHRKDQNYYVLATTGGGSSLRGNYFGEFDHITWVTMTDAGPSLANLRLDGILPHDIANKETQLLAGALANNATFEHVLLCNQGDKFTDGTLYLYFENPGEKPMTIHLQFYHQHQLIIPEPITKVTLNPKGKRVVEIPFSSPAPIAYHEAEVIQIDWQMKYELPEYPNFQFSGRTNFEVTPTKTSFLTPQIPKFLNILTVSAVHPYDNLKTVFKNSHSKAPDTDVIGEIKIEESGDVGIQLMNDKGQSTSLESRTFEKINKLHKAVKVSDPEEGLKYSYYEGSWDKLPEFDQLKAISNGVTQDFWVSDYALREDHFGMVFTGTILVQEDGLYIFRSRSDDACKLYIHNELVVNQDKVKEDFKDVGAIALKKGFHPVTIHFMEVIGRERLRLYFKKTYDNQWEELEVQGRFYH